MQNRDTKRKTYYAINDNLKYFNESLPLGGKKAVILRRVKY